MANISFDRILNISKWFDKPKLGMWERKVGTATQVNEPKSDRWEESTLNDCII